MCPIRVHRHVKRTIRNTDPNLNNVTQVFSFDYKPLLPYESINDTRMFYGMKYFNDLLMEARPTGSVQSEVLLQRRTRYIHIQAGVGISLQGLRSYCSRGPRRRIDEASVVRLWRRTDGETDSTKCARR
ncbi:hypothetical protein Fmac_030262 [Flemingia macrophylla]|uniref:COBRA C-terminal domain-containing protein n=1 Tax=Flemingia macrophylla TaxID=520843 RepID=A0ABD1LCX3_9FABA